MLLKQFLSVKFILVSYYLPVMSGVPPPAPLVHSLSVFLEEYDAMHCGGSSLYYWPVHGYVVRTRSNFLTGSRGK